MSKGRRAKGKAKAVQRKKRVRARGSLTLRLVGFIDVLAVELGRVRQIKGESRYQTYADPEVADEYWRELTGELADEVRKIPARPYMRGIDGKAGRAFLLRLVDQLDMIVRRDEKMAPVMHLEIEMQGVAFAGSGDRYRLEVAPSDVPRSETWNESGFCLWGQQLWDLGKPLPSVLVRMLHVWAADRNLSADEVQAFVDGARKAGLKKLFDASTLKAFPSGSSEEVPTPALVLSQHALWQPNQRLAVEVCFRYPNPAAGRNAAFEKAASASLKKTGAIRSDTLTGGYYADAKRILLAIPDLVDAGWSVESCGKDLHFEVRVGFDVREHADSYDVGVSLSFGDQKLSLADALAAHGRGETTVQLPDGSIAVLPDREMLRLRFLEVLNQNKTSGDRIHLKKAQAGVLKDWLSAPEGTVVFSGVGDWRASLTRLDTISPEDEAEPIAAFCGELRHYQKQGLAWLRYLRAIGFGGILADDMGLGKTVQILAFLAELHVADNADPSLIVAPRSLLDNWYREAAKFAPGLKVAVVHGSASFPEACPVRDADLILTTYGTLRSQLKSICKRRYTACVLDEAQAVKNPQTQSAQAVRQVSAAYRFCLSGTPVENHLGDLWSLFEFLNPGLLGSHRNFSRFIENPSLRPGAESLRALSSFVHPFILRRTKDAVLSELPEKTETTVYLDFDPEQAQAYSALREALRTKVNKEVDAVGLSKSKFTVFEALLRLRQCACHPALIDDKMKDLGSAKLDYLVNRAIELREEGHKLLVFSQFTSLLALLRERLDELGLPYAYLDGQTRDRQGQVDRFQDDPDTGIFLLSLKAGGSGLNLTAASYVFILDPWWNPAAEQQAVDRAHRMGQTQPVFAYRLVVKNTVEERLLSIQQHKKSLADAILSADKSVMKQLTSDDLKMLLS